MVGRMASCASWAFLTLDEYCFGAALRYCWPYSLTMAERVACIASSDNVTLSVRM